jgi:hypothetical protein
MTDGLEKKFDECDQCRHYHRRYGHVGSICRICTIGEHFLERISDAFPDDNELMRIYAKMEKEKDD